MEFIYSPLSTNSSIIAMQGSVFYRFHHYLRVLSEGIRLRPRERGRLYPGMQKNQCSEGRPPLMCKTCGKKGSRAEYQFNSLIEINLWTELLKKNIKNINRL